MNKTILLGFIDTDIYTDIKTSDTHINRKTHYRHTSIQTYLNTLRLYRQKEYKLNTDSKTTDKNTTDSKTTDKNTTDFPKYRQRDYMQPYSQKDNRLHTESKSTDIHTDRMTTDRHTGRKITDINTYGKTTYIYINRKSTDRQKD